MTTDPMQWDWTRAVYDHVHLRVADLAASKSFYAAVLEPLGIPLMRDTEEIAEFPNLAISSDGPVSEHVHIAFRAQTEEEVNAFHRAGIEAGYRDNGEPGPRPQYGPPQMTYYSAYLLDPDGNNVEAVYRAPAEQG
jgi:catechol 2,3-dioxygenase-like lactoylglutathione lyase family enzyme